MYNDQLYLTGGKIWKFISNKELQHNNYFNELIEKEAENTFIAIQKQDNSDNIGVDCYLSVQSKNGYFWDKDLLKKKFLYK